MSVAHVYPDGTPAPVMINHRRAWKVAPDSFEVVGRDGHTRYEVDIDDGGVPRCECKAGRRGRACYHAAIVLRRMKRERVVA